MSAQSRNSTNRMTDLTEESEVDTQGVGGRQRPGNTPQWGGGYQNVYSKTALDIYNKMLTDSRLDELRAHGLNDIWLEVAETIGYDLFIEIWQILDQKNSKAKHCDNARIRVPVFSSFMRFQRNKYITYLNKRGKTPEEIKILIKKELCENLAVSHIIKVIGKGNI